MLKRMLRGDPKKNSLELLKKFAAKFYLLTSVRILMIQEDFLILGVVVGIIGCPRKVGHPIIPVVLAG